MYKIILLLDFLWLFSRVIKGLLLLYLEFSLLTGLVSGNKASIWGYSTKLY